MAWTWLTVAIIAEVVATSALKAADGFTRPLPSLLVVVGYGIAFWGLSLALRSIPIGVAYAVWSAVGIVLVSVTAWIFYRQVLDTPALIGIGLIIAGVLVLQLWSKSVA
ncbi:MAG TPA: QacE family quaternary ammonium compound efflux SMR transporter [Gammaproteobacteria bacterium]|nr:QacE family quaternary ammonium compound efflux SMR transporter [Gammaproteobacteria bacterium]